MYMEDLEDYDFKYCIWLLCEEDEDWSKERMGLKPICLY